MRYTNSRAARVIGPHLEAVVKEVLFGEGDGVGQLGKRDAGV
jgi:hypothetical protein